MEKAVGTIGGGKVRALLLLLALAIPAHALTPVEREWVEGLQSAAAEERQAKADAETKADALVIDLRAARAIIETQRGEIETKADESRANAEKAARVDAVELRIKGIKMACCGLASGLAFALLARVNLYLAIGAAAAVSTAIWIFL